MPMLKNLILGNLSQLQVSPLVQGLYSKPTNCKCPYAYDTSDGSVVVLETNNSIDLGDEIQNSLLNPIQAEEQDVNIDVPPNCYYPNDPIIRCMIFEDGT